MGQKGKQTDIDDRPESMLPPFNIPAYSEEGFTSIIAPSIPPGPLGSTRHDLQESEKSEDYFQENPLGYWESRNQFDRNFR